MLVKKDWKEAFEHVGIQPGMLVVLEGKLHDLEQTVGQYNTFLDALLDVVSSEGTIVYVARNSLQNDPSEWEMDISIQSYDSIRKQLAESTNIMPTQDALANTMMLRDDCIMKRHPAFNVLVIGKYARFVTRKVPLHFPNGKTGPMQACVDLKGHVLLMNEVTLDSCVFSHALTQEKTPIVVAGGVHIENGISRWQKYLDVFVPYALMDRLYQDAIQQSTTQQIQWHTNQLTRVELNTVREVAQ